MAIAPLLVTDDALRILDLEQPNLSAALGSEGFLERFAASSHHVIGRTVPADGSSSYFESLKGFLRTAPDALLIDWEIFMATTDEANSLVPDLRLALETGHSVVIEARGANLAKLRIIAAVLQEPLGVRPDVFHTD